MFRCALSDRLNTNHREPYIAFMAEDERHPHPGYGLIGASVNARQLVERLDALAMSLGEENVTHPAFEGLSTEFSELHGFAVSVWEAIQREIDRQGTAPS